MFEPAPELTIDYSCGVGSSGLRLDGSSIKILSWNVARSNYSSGWVRDCNHIFESYQPTLIFLQEVALRDEDIERKEMEILAGNSAIAELAHTAWCFAPNFISLLNRSYSGILTAANAQPLKSQSLLSLHCEPIANTPKVSLFSEYALSTENKTPSKALLAINIHAINFVGLDKFEAQLQSIESKIAQHEGPVIFAGDFNTWSQKRWRSLYATAKRLRLNTVAFGPLEARKIKRFLGSPPLDHIFYRGFSQKVGSARVIDTLSTSDHNPLLVELIEQSPRSATTRPYN